MPSAAKAKKAAAKKGAVGKAVGATKPAAAAPAAPTADQPPTVECNVQLLFPASLTARQRAAVHAVGERYGLPHSSQGEGAERRIALGPLEAPAVELDTDAAAGSASADGGDRGTGSTAAASGGDGTSSAKGASGEPGAAAAPPLSDEQLVALIKQHLNLDASEAFAPSGNGSSSGGAAGSKRPAQWRGGKAAAAAKPGAQGLVTPEGFIASMLPLLEMEREAEVAQAEEALAAGSPESAAAKGRALLNLRLADAEGGLLGRTLLTLVNNKGGGSEPLPPHKLSPHDIVRVRPSKGDSSGPALAEGVVYRVRDSAITIAVDEVPDEGLDVPLRLEKMANQVTYQRLRAALTSLGGEGQRGPAAPLVDVLFGRRAPHFASTPPAWQPLNARLDESQQRGVSLALAAQDVALIHGPPGTGKTTAVVEFICQEVARGSRVLACAASNVAVDNLVERLSSQQLAAAGQQSKGASSSSSGGGPGGGSGGGPGGGSGSGGSGSSSRGSTGSMRVVRVGHPARLLPQVLEASLEARVLQSDNSALAKDCRKEMKALNQRLLKLVNRKDRDERRAVRQELRQLGKEERKRQEKAVEEVLRGAQVICTTLTGVGSRQLDREQFDVVVIDEAAQALEPACWAALLKGRKAVLAGDHLQLPPTVISDAAARAGLSRTLFERLQALWGPAASEMLTVQYRMNSAIMEWSSQELYDGRLEAHSSVAGHTMAGLVSGKGRAAPDASSGSDLPVLLLIDTAGCDMEEQQEEEGDSKWNDGEARMVMAHVRRLLAAGVAPEDIGVITPYSAQVTRLRELRPEALASRLEISTVDGFQGREKEAIVISMVRSNATRQVGFLSDARRMNVAITRARRHCTLVGDSDTVGGGGDAFLARLVAYFEEKGEYASAGEYEEEAAAAAAAGGGG